jgi:hypothetical protein
MQYNFNCEQILGCDPAGFAVLEGSFPKGVKPGYMPYVNEILDSIGFQSSKVKIKLNPGSRIEYSYYIRAEILLF